MGYMKTRADMKTTGKVPARLTKSYLADTAEFLHATVKSPLRHATREIPTLKTKHQRLYLFLCG